MLPPARSTPSPGRAGSVLRHTWQRSRTTLSVVPRLQASLGRPVARGRRVRLSPGRRDGLGEPPGAAPGGSARGSSRVHGSAAMQELPELGPSQQPLLCPLTRHITSAAGEMGSWFWGFGLIVA